jgi:hypothetical protein
VLGDRAVTERAMAGHAGMPGLQPAGPGPQRPVTCICVRVRDVHMHLVDVYGSVVWISTQMCHGYKYKHEHALVFLASDVLLGDRYGCIAVSAV